MPKLELRSFYPELRSLYVAILEAADTQIQPPLSPNTATPVF